MCNNNIWPNSVSFQATRLQSLSVFEYDLLRSLNVKSNGVIGLPIYGFLFMYNCNHMSIPHRLAIVAAQCFTNCQ